MERMELNDLNQKNEENNKCKMECDKYTIIELEFRQEIQILINMNDKQWEKDKNNINTPINNKIDILVQDIIQR